MESQPAKVGCFLQVSSGLSLKSNPPLPVWFRFPNNACVSAGPISCAAVPRARGASPGSSFIGWAVTTAASIVLARCHASLYPSRTSSRLTHLLLVPRESDEDWK